MRTCTHRIALAAAILASISPTAQTPPSILIRAARVIDGRGQATPHQTITVRGTKIVAVEQSTDAATYDPATHLRCCGFIGAATSGGISMLTAGGQPAPAARPTGVDGAENVRDARGRHHCAERRRRLRQALRDTIKRGFLQDRASSHRSHRSRMRSSPQSRSERRFGSARPTVPT